MRYSSNFDKILATGKVVFASVIVSLLFACAEKVDGPSGPDRPQGLIPTPLNDTGVSFFIDSTTNTLKPLLYTPNPGNYPEDQFGGGTEPAAFPGQDGSKGRDATPEGINNANGLHAFDFTKLDKLSGAELSSDATDFGCVKDKISGLVWENKIHPNQQLNDPEYEDLHDSTAYYSWYDPNPNTNGGNPGQQNGGSCTSAVIKSDTASFVKAVNNEKLCGFTDWRLPTAEELRSIVVYDKPLGTQADPMLDMTFFPHASDTLHRWTSQTVGSRPDRAFGFHLWQGKMQGHEKACRSDREQPFLNGAILVRNGG